MDGLEVMRVIRHVASRGLVRLEGHHESIGSIQGADDAAEPGRASGRLRHDFQLDPLPNGLLDFLVRHGEPLSVPAVISPEIHVQRRPYPLAPRQRTFSVLGARRSLLWPSHTWGKNRSATPPPRIFSMQAASAPSTVSPLTYRCGRGTRVG